MSLTSVFGMGTGGPSLLKTLTIVSNRGTARAALRSYRSQTAGARRHFPRSRPLPPAGRPSRRPQRSGRVLCHTRVRFGLSFGGAPSGIRTRDPLIKSQLLYQLS